MTTKSCHITSHGRARAAEDWWLTSYSAMQERERERESWVMMVPYHSSPISIPVYLSESSLHSCIDSKGTDTQWVIKMGLGCQLLLYCLLLSYFLKISWSKQPNFSSKQDFMTALTKATTITTDLLKNMYEKWQISKFPNFWFLEHTISRVSVFLLANTGI